MMIKAWYDCKDINGDVWPNWLVETRNPRYTRQFVELFNRRFQFVPNPLYDGALYNGLPLSNTAKLYVVHNQTFMGTYTDLVTKRAMRDNCAFCVVALSLTQTDGYPALVGPEGARIIFKMAPDFKDENVGAIYCLDLPTPLSLALRAFDNKEKRKRFDDYDWSIPFHSKLPSWGPIIRQGKSGRTERGGWLHTPRLLRERSERKSIREMMKELRIFR
jgi:hypothetical protein